jgi:hypothetical protein
LLRKQHNQLYYLIEAYEYNRQLLSGMEESCVGRQGTQWTAVLEEEQEKKEKEKRKRRMRRRRGGGRGGGGLQNKLGNQVYYLLGFYTYGPRTSPQ